MLPQINKILYATDLKENGSKKAFRMAVSLAVSHNAKLIVLHAMETLGTSMLRVLETTLSEQELATIRTQGVDNLKAELQKRIDQFCDEECPNEDHTYPGGAPVTVVDEGEPGEVILRNAKKYEVDLIVMGTRTHSGLSQFLLGSEANKVIHHSEIPVMIYPL